jgi:hypothetical protein
MPLPAIGAIGAIAARVGTSVAARGGAKAIAKTAAKTSAKNMVVRSATSMGHGTSATQFSPNEGSNYLNNDVPHWTD